MKIARVFSLVLAFALAYVVVEAAVHSVHHLNDADEENSCSVFAASQHVTGAIAETAIASVTLSVARDKTIVDVAPIYVDRAFRPDEGRAPPLAPSV